MLKPIMLTLHEFKLLINDESLKGFDSSAEDVPLEAGKGSDFHYTREIIRESDKAVLSITFTLNSEVGLQDWIRGGDFEIDHNKKDIYDNYGELIVEKEEVKEEVKEKTNGQIHNEMVVSGEIENFHSEQWLRNISAKSFFSIVDICQSALNINQENNILAERATVNECGAFIYKIAIDEKFNAERVWAETFQNSKMLKLPHKRLVAYFESRKQLAENNAITVVIGGKEVQITKTEMNRINKISSDIKSISPKFAKIL